MLMFRIIITTALSSRSNRPGTPGTSTMSRISGDGLLNSSDVSCTITFSPITEIPFRPANVPSMHDCCMSNQHITIKLIITFSLVSFVYQTETNDRNESDITLFISSILTFNGDKTALWPSDSGGAFSISPSTLWINWFMPLTQCIVSGNWIALTSSMTFPVFLDRNPRKRKLGEPRVFSLSKWKCQLMFANCLPE